MIRAATPADIPAIHRLIVELAIYEKEPDAVKATHDDLARALFGERPTAECVLAEQDGVAEGLAPGERLAVGVSEGVAVGEEVGAGVGPTAYRRQAPGHAPSPT